MARTSLDHLKATGEITIKTTNKYSVITITNYDSYQDDNTQDNVKVTSKQQADNKQLTTTKKEKKENKDKNIFKEKNKKEKIIVVDYQGIADKFHTSPEIVREYEEKVQDYMDSTGKTYKNMEATIRNWMRRDQEKKTSTPKTFQRLQLEENMQYKASQTAFIEQVLAEDAEGKNKKII